MKKKNKKKHKNIVRVLCSGSGPVGLSRKGNHEWKSWSINKQQRLSMTKVLWDFMGVQMDETEGQREMG